MRWFELVLVLAGLLEGVQGVCQTLPSATAAPRPCKFPFSFRGKDYFACTSDGDVSGAKWCETSAVSTPAPAAPSDSVFSAANEPVAVIASAGWGYCDAGCPLDHPKLQGGQVALETKTNTPKTNRDRCAQRHAQPCVPCVLCWRNVLRMLRTKDVRTVSVLHQPNECLLFQLNVSSESGIQF